MTHAIIVCTTSALTWECLRRHGACCPLALERVDRLEELAGRQGVAVDAVVVDDRFLPILGNVERSARRHSAVFHDSVFMTAGEALNALWCGPLGDTSPCSPTELSHWLDDYRVAPLEMAAM